MRRNEISEEDLDVLLALPTSVSGTSSKYLNTVASWDIDAELRVIEYSSRFSAICVQHEEFVIFFTVSDGEYFVFALSTNSKLRKSIPTIRIPEQGQTWRGLQEKLIKRFKIDEHARAIMAAIMISTKPTGMFKNVVQVLIPSRLRILCSCQLSYDAPIDEDMITFISNPCLVRGKLAFVSGSGYTAESTTNEMIGTLKRISTPTRVQPFEESGNMLMPYLFK